MPLYNLHKFYAHSGKLLNWKIDCDNLTIEDWECLAFIISKNVLFSEVEGVPTGGILLAEALIKYITPTSTYLLIVDDVLTTGKSMEEQRKGRGAVGYVVYSRITLPSWIRTIWELKSDA